MTPLLLVLLAAQSAWGASSVLLRTYDIDQIPRPVETSTGLVTPYTIESLWELRDEADSSVNVLFIEQSQRDLARSKDSRAQAFVLCQAIAVMGELATGRSGDACAFADFINNPSSVSAWLGRILYDIDAIVALSENKESLRDQVGPSSNCAGGGRTYNLEAAWNRILSEVNPFEIDLLNEQYCTAKRLYNAWNVRSNTVAAAVTSCTSPKAIGMFQRAIVPVANLARTVADCGNVAAAAAEAKAALLLAAN